MRGPTLEERQAEMRRRIAEDKFKPRGESIVVRETVADIVPESMEVDAPTGFDSQKAVRGGITRKHLYDEVWAEPMTTVAARYKVSANYLARVCHHLNVPHPPRGYWAKLQSGKEAKRPRLPQARPGEVLEWVKGEGVPRLAELLLTERNKTDRSPNAQSLHHQLVAGVRDYFEAGRFSEVGYLRPFKRNLVDILVSKPTLPYALDFANALFLAFEHRGHNVRLATPGEHFRRPELKLSFSNIDYYNREPWYPARASVVFVDTVVFGITICESTEEVEVTSDWSAPIRYTRVSASPTKRKSRYAYIQTPQKQFMPSGRLAVRAYSPYGGVEWQQTWQEKNVGEVCHKIKTIVKDLETAVPLIVMRREEARKQAEVHRRQWEIEQREYERQEKERRMAEALKASRQQLVNIVEGWTFARGFDNFFHDIEQRASLLPSDEREKLLERIGQARAMLGGADTLAQFRKWKPPQEL